MLLLSIIPSRWTGLRKKRLNSSTLMEKRDSLKPSSSHQGLMRSFLGKEPCYGRTLEGVRDP